MVRGVTSPTVNEEVRKTRLHRQPDQTKDPPRPTEKRDEHGYQCNRNKKAREKATAKHSGGCGREVSDVAFQLGDLLFLRQSGGLPHAQPRLQHANHFRHGLKAVRRVLLHHPLNHGREFFGHARNNLLRGNDRVVSVLGHQFDRGATIERRPPGNQDIQGATQRIDIRAMIDRSGIAALLRRHIRRRSQRDPRTGEVRRVRRRTERTRWRVCRANWLGRTGFH